jgi:hypothetical protein
VGNYVSEELTAFVFEKKCTNTMNMEAEIPFETFMALY